MHQIGLLCDRYINESCLPPIYICVRSLTHLDRSHATVSWTSIYHHLWAMSFMHQYMSHTCTKWVTPLIHLYISHVSYTSTYESCLLYIYILFNMHSGYIACPQGNFLSDCMSILQSACLKTAFMQIACRTCNLKMNCMFTSWIF